MDYRRDDRERHDNDHAPFETSHRIILSSKTNRYYYTDNVHYVRNDGTWEGYDFIKSTAMAKCATYTNSSNWFEFSVNNITNMSGTASTDYSLGKEEGGKGYLRVNRDGMYALNGFVNVSELNSTNVAYNIGFRTEFSDNTWVFSHPSPVYVDSNAITSNGYSSLTVPTAFSYIKTGTRITLGFDRVFAKRIGSMTNFQIRRIG